MQASAGPETRTTPPIPAPPGPTRARLTFELIAVVGAVALAIGLLIVGPSARTPVGWRTYGDPSGRFEVSVPGSFETSATGNVVRFVDGDGMPALSLETYSTGTGAAHMADSDRENFGCGAGGELQLAPTSVGGVEALQMTQRAVGTETNRVYVDIPGGVVILVATGPIDGFDSTIAEDYFQSFDLR